MTFTSHYNDLEDVVKWAKTQGFYTEPFALAGHSLGAIACVLYASKFPKKVDLLVSASLPWLDGKKADGNKEALEAIKRDGFWSKHSESTGKTFKFYQNYYDDTAKYNLTNVVKNITANTFIVVGLKDAEAHIESNKQLYQLLKCKRELILLENVPHDLANTPETKEIFSKAISDLLKQ